MYGSLGHCPLVLGQKQVSLVIRATSTFGILQRTPLMTLVLAMGFWIAAALVCDPADNASLLRQELISTSAQCRDSIENCARPVARFFSSIAEGASTVVDGVEKHLRAGSEITGEIAESWPLGLGIEAGSVQDVLQSVKTSLSERIQTVNLLVLLFVLRICSLKTLLPVLAVFALAALLDAWCMRRIVALTFSTPMPSVNFWLVQTSGVLAAGAVGIAAMPFVQAPLVAFICLILFVHLVAEWLRTHHKFLG